jgi:plastocyanin
MVRAVCIAAVVLAFAGAAGLAAAGASEPGSGGAAAKAKAKVKKPKCKKGYRLRKITRKNGTKKYVCRKKKATNPSGGSGGGTGTGGTDPSGGGTDPVSGGGAPLPRRLAVNEGEYYVNPSRSLVGSGNVELYVNDYGQDAHNLTISDAGGQQVAQVDVASGDRDVPLSVDLPPGNYRLFCSLFDHDQLGMNHALTVK